MTPAIEVWLDGECVAVFLVDARGTKNAEKRAHESLEGWWLRRPAAMRGSIRTPEGIALHECSRTDPAVEEVLT